MQVVGAVDGLCHEGRVVDGYKVQRVVGLLGGSTPHQLVVGLVLYFPVAERNQDGVELQSLGLVDGQDAYAVEFAAGDGLATEGFVPEVQESVDVRRVVLKIVGHGVEEGKEVGVLLLHARQAEEAEQLFKQFVEGHQAQLVQAVGKRWRQGFLRLGSEAGIPVGGIGGGWFFLGGQGGVVQGQRGAGYLLSGVGQVAQGIDEHAHGLRGIQPESFVGYDGQVERLVEVVGYGRYVLVLAHQDGDVVQSDTVVQQAGHLLAKGLQGDGGIVVLVVGFQEGHLDIAFCLLLG